MKRSVVIAIGFTVVCILWIASGSIGRKDKPEPTNIADRNVSAAAIKPSVRVLNSASQQLARSITIQGTTKAERVVMVKAEQSGRVTAILSKRGDRVADNALLLEIAEDDRLEAVNEAKASVENAQIEFNASKKLMDKGLRSESNMAGASSKLNAAKASLTRANLALENTKVRAPFAGVFNDHMVEVGDFVDIGEPLAAMYDLEPIVVVGSVSEQSVHRLKLGAAATVTVLNGTSATGTVSYIAAAANPVTRTFEIRVDIANPDGSIPDGVTATVQIFLEQVLAHKVSPSVLGLSDDGRLIVKTVNDKNIVSEVPVTILNDAENSVWLDGLPMDANIIAVGQEFVIGGQEVIPVSIEAIPNTQPQVTISPETLPETPLIEQIPEAITEPQSVPEKSPESLPETEPKSL